MLELLDDPLEYDDNEDSLDWLEADISDCELEDDLLEPDDWDDSELSSLSGDCDEYELADDSDSSSMISVIVSVAVKPSQSVICTVTL